jgi:uncharacterized membrane protein YeaQ/YmgE (transglycosylase-associated protein family)
MYMTLEQVVLWIIVGGIAGLIAEFFVRGTHVGLIGTVIVGILGALLGGWLFRQLHIAIGTGFVSEIITAAIGAIVLLVLLRLLRRL